MAGHHSALYNFILYGGLIYFGPAAGIGVALAVRYIWGVIALRHLRRTPWSWPLGLAWLISIPYTLYVTRHQQSHDIVPQWPVVLNLLTPVLWWLSLLLFLSSRRTQRTEKSGLHE